LDKWIFRVIARKQDTIFQKNFGITLAGNPAVLWYITNKCPETADYYNKLVMMVPTDLSTTAKREAEVYILDALDWAVVYVYPEIMEKLSYIVEWNNERLLSITNFTDKTVLDIGSGTGRLAFAAAPLAKYVYASEPVDRLREYLRVKQQRLEVKNMYVVNGEVESLPFPDATFDIVMSGHVVGDNYQAEWREMSRVAKPGGWVIDCPGEDDRKKPDGPAKAMIELGFSYSHYISKMGGDVYRYWRQK